MGKVASFDLTRCVAGVVLLLVAATLALQYRQLGRWSGRYLLASNEVGARDREVRLLASSIPALTYARADGEVAAEVQAAQSAPTLRLYSFALILGSLLGLVLSRGVQRRPEIPLLLAACVSVAKARMVCSTCLPSATVGSLDAAWVGAAIYTAAAFGCLARPGSSRAFAVGAAGGGIAWQAAQLLSNVPDCALCQSVMAINAALLAATVVAERATLPDPKVVWRRYAWLGCVAVPAPVISQPMADRAHETAVRSKLDYTGKSVDVLLPKVEVPKAGLLVMFGKPTCTPCVEAHRTLERASPIPFLPVEVVGRDEKPQWGGATIPYDTSRIDATPLFLIVRGDRRIVGMHRGWSGEAGWLVQFARIVSDDLRPDRHGS